MAHDVFISYSSKDKTIADTVCAKLEENGIRCWIAPRDVPPGENFSGSIVDAIDNCKVFVLIWSSNANVSDHILNEINQAFDSGITVLPFRVEDVQPSKSLKYYIGRTHWLDAITPPLEQHIEKLAKTINHLLTKEASEKSEISENVKQTPKSPKNRLIKSIPVILGLIILVVVSVLFFNKFIPPVSKIDSGKTPQASPTTDTDRLKVCQVTDFGGIEGEGFGYSYEPVVWDAIQREINNSGIEARYFESHQISDFATNLQSCKDWGAKLIFAVGYKAEMQSAVVNAAKANPQIYYASVDGYSDGTLPNQRGMLLSWGEGTFLAGYLSASMTQTGKVGTFAGTMMPVIQEILDGYSLGVEYYNEQHNADVKLLGYDPAQPELAYLMENWTSLESALGMLDLLIADGADVFLPVCGKVAIESVYDKYMTTGIGLGIGTDYDMTQVYPEYSPIILASIVKRPDVMVTELITEVSRGEWSSNVDFPLSLENGGLAFVYGKDWIDRIPSDTKKEITAIIADIKSGNIAIKIDR